jgi:two-component system sensor histidine kinase AlgZ
LDALQSIRENPAAAGLPDFRTPAVWLQTLLAGSCAAILYALAANQEWRHLLAGLTAVLLRVEPVLLVSLIVLSVTTEWLMRLPLLIGRLFVVLLTLLAAAAVQGVLVAYHVIVAEDAGLGRAALWTVIGTLGLLTWFELRARAQSPALAEARLLALTARIRPHFLFNALNGILGVIRSDPRRAETALEELADLFRVLMRENAELVPLSEEIAVARQYLNLERLRLGERIRVEWDMAECPPDPLVPPLMLQPLLENAVYHGIEPATKAGEIRIRFERRGHRVRLELSNPVVPGERHVQGNQMALANIRERLLLFFELDAAMTTGIAAGRFHVTIEFPYRSRAE